MSINKTAAIIHTEVGAESSLDDLDVLEQVKNVSKSLKELGFNVHVMPFTASYESMASELKNVKPDFIFNLVESINGEGRLAYLAPSFFDELKIKYTGCPTQSILLTTDKIETKKILRQHGIPTADWIYNDYTSDFKPNQTYIIKAVSEDASIGLDLNSVVTVKTLDELKNLLAERRSKFNKDFFAERYIEGREFNVALVGNQKNIELFPVSEIKFIDYDKLNKPKILDYNAKWETNSFEYSNTIRSFDYDINGLFDKLQNIALECWKVFNLTGYARVDYRVDKEGNPWVLEINPNPCISPDSGFIGSGMQKGLSYTDIIEKITCSII